MSAVRFCATIFLLSTVFTAGVRAHQVPCNALPGGRLPWCTAVQLGKDLKEAIQDMREGKEQYAQNLASKIAAARQHFRSLPEAAPGQEEASVALENLLVEKDFWFIEQEEPLVMRGVLDTFMFGRFNIEVDGGIRPIARGWFSTWENFIHDRVRGDRHESLEQAVDESRPIYEHYRLARQWAEAASMGKGLPSDPNEYTQLLITLDSPWVVRGYGADPNYAKTVVAYHDALKEVFGAETFERAARATMALPKDRDGFVNPALEMGGRKWRLPWQALRALLGKDSGRNYLILSVMQDRHDLSAAGMRQAAQEYSRWSAGYGDKQVNETAMQVARLAKDDNNLIADAGSIGFPNLRQEYPYALVQKILIAKDPTSYARTVLAFHDNLTSSEATHAALTTLSSRYGEKATADAAKALAGLWVTGEYLPPNGDRDLAQVRFSSKPDTGPASDYSLLMGILTGSVKLARGTQIENPDYKLWVKYKPGTTVTYERRSWWVKNGELIPSPVDHDYTVTSWKLKAVDAQAVLVDYASQLFSSGQPRPRKDELRYPVLVNKEETSEARMEAVQKSQTSYAGTEHGTETLKVNGKAITCQWSKVTFRNSPDDFETTTTWTSDEVPGGLVMIARDRGATTDRTVIKSLSVEEGSKPETLASSIPTAGTIESPAVPKSSYRANGTPSRGVPLSEPVPSTSSPVIPAGTALAITLTDSIDSSVADSGRKVHGRTSQAILVSGQAIAQKDSDVVLNIRKMPSYGNITQVAISIDSIAAGAQTLPVVTNEVARAFRTEPRSLQGRRAIQPTRPQPNGVPPGTLLYFRVKVSH